MPKLVLIDSFGFIFRAYHALPHLQTTQGVNTNAVYGFVRMALNLIEDMKADYIAAIYDSPTPVVRKEIYPDYKANRKPAPEDLLEQIPLVKEALKALNIVTIEYPGAEADDIIASYVRLARQKDLEVIIISSDKDLMQLVSSEHRVSMYDSVKKMYIKEPEVLAKFGVEPKDVRYAQALIGDSSDNIPGVKGLGVVGAAKLVQEYGTLENIYQNLDQIKGKATKNKLIADKDNAFLSLRLVTLDEHVPLKTKLPALRRRPLNPYLLYEFCNSLEFTRLSSSLKEKYGLEEGIPQAPDEGGAIYEAPSADEQDHPGVKYKYWVVKTVADLEELSLILAENPEVYVAYTDTSLALIPSSGSTAYLVLMSQPQGADLMSLLDGEGELKPFSSISYTMVAKHLAGPLSSAALKKVALNIKQLTKHMRRHNLGDIKSFDDIRVMAYTLGGPQVCNSLEQMYNYGLGSQSSLESLEADFEEALPLTEDIKNPLLEALAVKKIFGALKVRMIAERCKGVYEQVNKPIIPVLDDMERRGICVNKEVLDNLSEDISADLQKYEEEIFAIVGHKFNLGSPKQIGQALFDTLGLAGKKNKTGSWKTDANFLEELDEQGVPIAKLLLEWRQLNKLQSTYLHSLPNYIDPTDGRIHTTYMQTSTSTGRLSSNDPNLQNIPIKTQLGRKIREAFVPARGFKLVSVDFSQIELRLLAHIGEVDPLIADFRTKKDIHSRTAQEMFNLEPEEVSSDYRSRAKAINFGIIYGISEFGLAKNLHIAREVARDYIQSYFTKYPQILRYMDQAKQEAHELGYVTTITGKKCFIPSINSHNGAVKAFAERAAINAKLQGSAADIMNLSTKAVSDLIKSEFLDKAFLVLQIHDELVFEVAEDIAEEFAQAVAKVMCSVYPLTVPLEVNYSIGDNWLDAH